jgi:hypothetical protein
MATLCAAWGVAIGLRALWPGTSRRAGPWRGRRLQGGGCCWPTAASASSRRTPSLSRWSACSPGSPPAGRPELRSWVSYGPALAAGFLPSLALVLAGPGAPWRRLLLGLAALLVVLAGSVRRRRAVVAGGGCW